MSPTPIASAAELAHRLDLLDALVPELEGYRYVFLDLSTLAIDISPGQFNQLYWKEILFRAHWSACASLIRSQRWLAGIKDSLSQANLPAFAACARGLLEAAADTHDALNDVAPTLAEIYGRICKALNGDIDHPLIAEALENRLIHFTHASKPDRHESVPPQVAKTTKEYPYAAKTTKEYLAALEAVEPRVGRLYCTLCDIVHPGASSILSYATVEGAEETGPVLVLLTQRNEKGILDGLAFEVLVNLAPWIMAFGLTTSVLVLKTLNAFPIDSVHTSFIDKLDLSNIPAWQKICALLKTHGVGSTTHDSYAVG